MRVATATLCSLLLLAAGGLAGCTPEEENEVAMEDGTVGEADEETGEGTGYDGGVTGEDETGPGEGEAGAQVFLEGELTDEGVECPAFRSDDGELYTLTGDLGGFRAGDRVRIVATPVEMSTCMQGTTVNVVEISPIDDEPAI